MCVCVCVFYFTSDRSCVHISAYLLSIVAVKVETSHFAKHLLLCGCLPISEFLQNMKIIYAVLFNLKEWQFKGLEFRSSVFLIVAPLMQNVFMTTYALFFHLRNDLLCVKWDVECYTLTHSLFNAVVTSSQCMSNTISCWHVNCFAAIACSLFHWPRLSLESSVKYGWLSAFLQIC